MYKAKYLSRTVAAKRILLSSKNKIQNKTLSFIQSETTIHSLLHCDSIVQLVGCCKMTDKVYIVTEYVSGPDMDTFLFNNKSNNYEKLYNSLKPKQFSKMASDMSSACQYLHESQKQPIIHRDLKPGNFVIRISDMTVKLIDLGIGKIRRAQTFGKTAFSKDIAGTWSYCSPEKLLDQIDGNVPIDIWSLGCCLAELLTRSDIWVVPDDDDDEVEFIKHQMVACKAPHALQKLQKLKGPHVPILQRALDYSPKSRPSAGQITAHFMKNRE